MYPVFEIDHQEEYSRGELLLRTFFGAFYIVLPHAFILMFLGIWSSILTFIAFWSILFTGRYPESMFEYQERLVRWQTRLNAVTLNLSDGYPAFGLTAEHPGVEVEIPYPEDLSRGEVLLKAFFGWLYVGLPHGLILMVRIFVMYILMFVAWWVVLFTGEYPRGIHEFNVGTLRWAFRANLYLQLMTDRYPPFNGQPDPYEGEEYDDYADDEADDFMERNDEVDESAEGDDIVPDPDED